MNISEAFLVNTKNFDAIIETLVRYDDEQPLIDSSLLEMLGYSDPNDLLVVRLLKDLNILNQDGEPGTYFDEFQDPGTTQKALAKGMLDAYAPLFEKDEEIHKAGIEELKTAFDDAFDGKKTKLIIKYISGTFHKIATYTGAETIDAVMAERKQISAEEPETEMAVAQYHANGTHQDESPSVSFTTDQDYDHDPQHNLKDTPMPENEEHVTDFDSQTSLDNEEHEDFDANPLSESAEEDIAEEQNYDEDPFDTESEGDTEKNGTSFDKDPVDLSVSMADVTQPKPSSVGKDYSSAAGERERYVEKALIRKSELLHQLQRWEELIPALDEVLDRFDNAEHSYLDDIVARSIVRRAFVLVKLHRNGDALPALDQVITRFRDAGDRELYKHASVAMLHKAELLEEDSGADLLPLYDAIIDRLDGDSNDHLSEKVEQIFNKRFDLILKEGSQKAILDASEEIIERYAEDAGRKAQLQRAMIKKAEVLDETERSEEALKAYDEFLAKFG